MAKPIVMSCRLCAVCWKVIPEGRCSTCRKAQSAIYREKYKALGKSYHGIRNRKPRRQKSEITVDEIRAALKYDQLTGDFCRWNKRSPLGTLSAAGYVMITIFDRKFRAHRLAWLFVHGQWPSMKIDHINGSRIDNRIANLREASDAVNSQNLRGPKSNNTSGYLGVMWREKSKKWEARITALGRAKVLGFFDDPKEASDAYLAAKRLMHEGCTV